MSDVDQSARDFDAFLVGCAGRDASEEDLREFLIRAGLGGPDTDFQALSARGFWVSCRQTLSWYSRDAVRSAAAGIDGFERLGAPTLLVRGRSTSPWLSSVIDFMGERLSGATTVEIDGGHACILESPEQFVAALEGQLTGASVG